MEIPSKVWNYLKSPGPMALIAIVSIFFGVYQTYYFEKRGELEVSIDAITPVYDVYRPVGGLQIFYQGRDMRSAQRTLWAVTVSFKNVGNAELRKMDFDESVPVGVHFDGGEILDSPSVKATNGYLAQQAKPKITKSTISISPAIFEPGESVQLDILLIAPVTVKPQVSSVGKVAGSKFIHIATPEARDSQPFYKKVFDDSEWPVHLARAAFYLLCILLVPTLIFQGGNLLVYPFEALRRFKDRKKAKEVLSHFNPPTISREGYFVRKLYTDYGIDGLNSLNYVVKWIRDQAQYDELYDAFSEEAVIPYLLRHQSGVRLAVLKRLKTERYLSVVNRRPQVNEELIRLAEELATFAGEPLL